MPALKKIPQSAVQQQVERQVERILEILRTKPDSGFAAFMQTFHHHPEPIRQALVFRMAAHYVSSNGEYSKKLEEENKRLKQPPHQVGILESVCRDEGGNRYAVVSTHEGVLEVPISEDLADAELVSGTRVALAKNGAIVAVRGLPPVCPAIEFSRVLPDGRILSSQGDQHLVLKPAGDLLKLADSGSLKPGDLLEYDAATRQAIRRAEHSTKTREFVAEPPDATWTDIGGLDDIVANIEEEVLGPIVYRDAYEPYGVRPPRGILFEGPPGVGKTLLVKATGRALLSALQLKDDAPVLFRVKGTALQSPYVGEGPARIRALAAAAREAAAEYGLAIIMLDDFEYGGGLHRGVGDRSSPAYSTLSSALISEMDGIDDRDARVIWAATVNRSDLLDSALLRPGRFSKKISVPRPGPEACVQILLVHLRQVPTAERLSANDLAEQAVQRLFSCDDDNLLARVHFADAGHEEIFPSRIISGAVLAESVRGAALQAIRRDRSSKLSKPSGVGLDDLYAALYEQLNSMLAAVTPSNAHMHYLGLPEDRRVVSVEHVWVNRHGEREMFLK